MRFTFCLNPLTREKFSVLFWIQFLWWDKNLRGLRENLSHIFFGVGGFHLHLLEFPLYSRITSLVVSKFRNLSELVISSCFDKLYVLLKRVRQLMYTANIYSGNWDTRKKCKSYKYLPSILPRKSVDFIVKHCKLVFTFFHCTKSSN